MARPRTPLIERSAAIAAALEIIDRDGLDSFSMRRLGAELGVNGASLYHHFRDKDEILQGVRLHVMREGQLADLPTDDGTWQTQVRHITVAYRTLLLQHPNVAPLMAPTVQLRPFSYVLRDRVAIELHDSGVPEQLALAIIDSMETLAYASAILNPAQLSTEQRLDLRPDDDVPALARAARAAPQDPDVLFELQLDALITGWTTTISQA